MGIGKWLARRGAVGGTARWAANGYKFFRQRHPDPQDFSDSQIFRLMIVTRYETLPDDNAKGLLLQLADEVMGLRGLVAAILSVEASFDPVHLAAARPRAVAISAITSGGAS